MNYTTICNFFMMFVFCTSCKGQNKTELPKNNTQSEIKNVIISTVPNYITRTIKQDRKGNIWIAAFDGVFRYDGKSFINITSKVSSARFFSVLEDIKGNFWFSSVGSGIYYYNGKSFRNFTTKEGLPNNRVGDIYQDKKGNIWFGTSNGASRYDGKSFRNYIMDEGIPSSIDNAVNSIVEDKAGDFWFGTNGNAFVYNGNKFTILTHNGKHFTNVRSIIEDKKGNIWLGGKDGLWRYDGSTFINFTENFVGYIYEDKKGNIWTSSEAAQGWVLFRYDEKSLSNKEPLATGIKSKGENIVFGALLSNKNPSVTEIKPKGGNMICGILEANDGSIWFGTTTGVYRYNGNTITDFKGKQAQ